MLQTIFDFVRPWPVIAQCVSLILISGMLTAVVLAIIGIVGDFINNSLPVLLRGYAPGENATVDQKQQEEES